MAASEEVALWGSLLKHPAWAELEQLCDEHVSNVASQVLQPSVTMEDALRQNVERGRIMGVHYVIGLPRQLWEMAKEKVKQEEDDDNDQPVEEPAVP